MDSNSGIRLLASLRYQSLHCYLLLSGSVVVMTNELDRSRDIMMFQMNVINDIYGADTTILLLLCR